METQNTGRLFEAGDERTIGLARLGGRASGEARRRRRTLREELLLILSGEDVQRRVSTALVNEAIEGNRSGSVARAFEILRDTIGERPVERVRQETGGSGLEDMPTSELRRMAGEQMNQADETETADAVSGFLCPDGGGGEDDPPPERA